MKKAERIDHIQKRAYELAYTGEYSRWLEIEWQIGKETPGYVKEALDIKIIRDALDDICKIAQSPSEVENKVLFKEWILKFIVQNSESLKNEFPEVSLNIRDDNFIIENRDKKLKVTKIFDSRRLHGVLSYNENGNYYVNEMRYSSTKGFDEFNADDWKELIKCSYSNY